MTDEVEQDIPKTVANVMVALPPLTIRTGWAYLRMKKRAQRMSKVIKREMVSEGMPEHMAARLADEFASGISIRRLIRDMDIPFVGGSDK
jgi:hypothetical protein